MSESYVGGNFEQSTVNPIDRGDLDRAVASWHQMKKQAPDLAKPELAVGFIMGALYPGGGAPRNNSFRPDLEQIIRETVEMESRDSGMNQDWEVAWTKIDYLQRQYMKGTEE